MEIAKRIGGSVGRRRRRRRPIKVMELWKKMVFPVRKLCLGVVSRLKARKNGAALLKLHNDIQTCGYEDVQVMWEMLRKTESEMISRPTKRKQKPFWRIFLWHNHEGTSTFSVNKLN